MLIGLHVTVSVSNTTKQVCKMLSVVSVVHTETHTSTSSLCEFSVWSARCREKPFWCAEESGIPMFCQVSVKHSMEQSEVSWPWYLCIQQQKPRNSFSNLIKWFSSSLFSWMFGWCIALSATIVGYFYPLFFHKGCPVYPALKVIRMEVMRQFSLVLRKFHLLWQFPKKSCNTRELTDFK